MTDCDDVAGPPGPACQKRKRQILRGDKKKICRHFLLLMLVNPYSIRDFHNDSDLYKSREYRDKVGSEPMWYWKISDKLQRSIYQSEADFLIDVQDVHNNALRYYDSNVSINFLDII